MTSEIFGLDGVIILIIALVALVVPIWALVDSVSRPSGALPLLDHRRVCGSL